MIPRTLIFCIALSALAAVALSASPAVPDADGIMLPRNRVNLGLPIEARVREMRVEEGKAVHKGDVLAILYSEAEELNQVRAAAQLRKAEYIYRSKLRLKESQSVAEQEMVEAEVDLELAKVELDRTKAELRDKTLTAPWDGQVLRLYKSVGETVNRGEKVIELIDYSTIYVDVYLDAKYLTAVKHGQKVEVGSAAVGPARVTATVLMVDPVIEPGSGLSRVRLLMSNPDLRIPTGLPVKVQFQPAELAAQK